MTSVPLQFVSCPIQISVTELTWVWHTSKKKKKKGRIPNSVIMSVLHMFFGAFCIFSVLCVFSFYWCFILQLPGCKQLRAPANFAHMPEMTCKTMNCFASSDAFQVFHIQKIFIFSQKRENGTTEAVDELLKISVPILVVWTASAPFLFSHSGTYVAVSSAKVQINACVQRLTSGSGCIYHKQQQWCISHALLDLANVWRTS